MSEVDVLGNIFNGDKFMVERRGLDEKSDLDIVCLPGGHIRKNESREEALKRELNEELGIKVKRLKYICKNFLRARALGGKQW